MSIHQNMSSTLIKVLVLYVVLLAFLLDTVSCFQPHALKPKRNWVHKSCSQNDYDINTNVHVSEKDREQIKRQLGYIPDNLVSIAARRGGGIETPLVLKTYPLNGGASRRKLKAEGDLTPFPTLYWFCCNEVGKAVSELERRGCVRQLEIRLRDEPDMLERFILSHDSYAKERWDSLTEFHQEHIMKNERMLKMLRYSGVAGTDYTEFHTSKGPSIKCLHAHYAHYRGQIENNCDKVNIVGKWIDDLLKEQFPDLIL